MVSDRGLSLGFVAALLVACSPGGPKPLAPVLGQEPCAFCRMVVGDLHTAAQLQAPGEEVRFFDDLGCLRDFHAAHPPAAGAVAYVTDHRTGEWVPAARAVFTHVPGLATPMGSGLVAHADEASRDADPAARGGTPLDRSHLFGPAGPPGGPP